MMTFERVMNDGICDDNDDDDDDDDDGRHVVLSRTAALALLCVCF